MKQIKNHRCISCRKLFKESEIEYAPDPYASDVYNDNTKVWMCGRCRKERAEDI